MQLALVGEQARELSPRFQLYLDAYEAEHLPARNYATVTRAMYAAEVRFFLVFVEELGLKAHIRNTSFFVPPQTLSRANLD